MFSLSKANRFYIYHQGADMRKGFDSLCGVVRNEFLQDPLSGDVFVFLNTRRTHIKLLQWQDDGFAIFYKRLERGTYELPKNHASSTGELSYQQLLLISEGISLLSIRKLPRYQQKG
jgi:transposase